MLDFNGGNEEEVQAEEVQVVQAEELVTDSSTTNNVPVTKLIKKSSKKKSSKPYPKQSYTVTHTIPKGTLLYNASKSALFDFTNVRINEENPQNLIGFFTTNKKVALARIKDCAVENIEESGYIHVFKVMEDVPDIYIISQYDLKSWNANSIVNTYCHKVNNENRVYNGVGFFMLKNKKKNSNSANEDETSNNKNMVNPSEIVTAEYVLCNISANMNSGKNMYKYKGRIRCKSFGQYSNVENPFNDNMTTFESEEVALENEDEYEDEDEDEDEDDNESTDGTNNEPVD